MLFDSDVIIWLLRKSEAAADAIESAERVAISVVTYMEVIRGLRDRREMREMREMRYMLTDYGFSILPLTESIGYLAARYVEEYKARPGLAVPDALIAATAVEHGRTLCTANAKHFRPITDLEIAHFRP
jgi:predicted nucleic acid-binding protein